MKAWLAIPSARPAREANLVLEKWRGQGYGIALFLDNELDVPLCDFYLVGKYPGYAASVNAAAKQVLQFDPECQFVVTGGDDISPDPDHTADEIVAQCIEHFGGTFGVMQPTGDRWGEPAGTAYIDRVAASPWLGREYCERMYGGNGPLWHEYLHMFSDAEIQDVAIKLGVFWQRRDLVHLHDHWQRNANPKMPEFLREACSPAHWNHYGNMFRQRKSAGFPGHQPLSR